MKHLKHQLTDYLGISGSMLCLIHCLAVPFLFIGHELYDGHSHDHWSEAFTHVHQPLWQSLTFNWDHFFLLIALVAAIHTVRKSHRQEVKMIIAIGWLMFFSGVLFFYPLVHLGSIILISGHLLNLYFCRKECRI